MSETHRAPSGAARYARRSEDALVVGERTLAPGLSERRLANERLRHVPPTCPAVRVGLAAVLHGVKSVAPDTNPLKMKRPALSIARAASNSRTLIEFVSVPLVVERETIRLTQAIQQ